MRAKNYLIFSSFLFILNAFSFANRYIPESELWQHVVTLDRVAWQEREAIEQINKVVDEQSFVRRLYIDITGKIPTYKELQSYLGSKDLNKRSKLIETLLSSNGYVTNFTNFWNDLLRNPHQDPELHFHREFTRYIERFLSENKPYDKIVYDLLMTEGTVQENQGIGFYVVDRGTDVMDTFNASVRAFLGTRLGCAQCHNHRFDKWTQKEFYEAAAHLWGTEVGSNFGQGEVRIFREHFRSFQEDKRFKGKLSPYAKVLFNPSSPRVTFKEKEVLKYPFDYAYQNAKPHEKVKERIIFNYGDSETKAENRRAAFATWMTSKNNPVFARVMANRLWKRIMGVAVMEPVDDWKDSVIVENPNLFKALGEIFIKVDYDFKAFLSVVFNSEAYQLAFDVKNSFKPEHYKTQGAILKRMSSSQINDSLLTLQYGNLEHHSKLDPQYFEFEDKLFELSREYLDEALPLALDHHKRTGVKYRESTDDRLIDLNFVYLKKLKELEKYYDIDSNGRIKSLKTPAMALAVTQQREKNKSMMSEKENMKMEKMTMMSSKTMTSFEMAHYKTGDLMTIFGATDRSAPDTNVETGATMTQILKLMNSAESRNAVSKDSFLIKELFKIKDFSTRIEFLFYSIYGRAPSHRDESLAKKYIHTYSKMPYKQWANYTLALINSPEFYFIK